MTENELKQLKKLPIPPPAEGRKRRRSLQRLRRSSPPRSLSPANPKRMLFRHV